jgi:DNA-binding SARP family transcriptional activator
MTTITADPSDRRPRETGRRRPLTPRSQIQVELFGKFRARPEALQALESGKAQELLCYLLVHRHRPQSREQLAAVLWPEGSPERTKKYLRQALWHLQAALDRAAPEEQRLITSDGAWVQLSPTARIDLDVGAFEEAYLRCRRTTGSDLDSCSVALLDSAVQLYHGDLLEGWYQDWCLYERERLQSMYLTMLDKLMLHSTAHGFYEAGLAYGQRSLRQDRARERTHRQLMQLYHLAGERVAALRQFQTCHDILKEELGVRPSRRTVVLYDQIRLEQPDGDGSAPRASDPPPAASASEVETVTDLLAHLRQLRSALADIERQVSRDIQSIECVLSRPLHTDSDRAH